jgi:hypothetical protein
LHDFKARFAPHERRFDASSRTWCVPSACAERVWQWAQRWFEVAAHQWDEEEPAGRTDGRGMGAGPLALADAYKVLHLLPSAPPEPVQAAHALDEAGTATIGPLVEGPDGFCVGDRGAGLPGRTPAEIAALFSIARPFRSSKVRRLPTRGALGNGLRVVSGAVLATGGHLEVETRGQHLRLVVQDDGTTAAELIGQTTEPGTRIRVYVGPSLRVRETDLNEAHLAIALAGRGTTYRGLSSPHWYDAATFYELPQAAGQRAVRAVVATLDGCTGAKAGRITRGRMKVP